MVFLLRAKPRYLDMVSHFKATYKHQNPIIELFKAFIGKGKLGVFTTILDWLMS